MKFPKLFKYTKTGSVQEWKIYVKDNYFWTEEGIRGGKITRSMPTYCKGKNIGKKNATTDNEQAILEAKSKHKKKVDSGYNEELTAEVKFFKPMLARDYNKAGITFSKKTCYFNGQIVKAYIQPKLDGIRCVNTEAGLFSRNGKPFHSCPHLKQETFTFDGELYNHKFCDNFGEIVSLCKKGKPSEEDLKISAQNVEYWIYDTPEIEGVFSERYKALKKMISLTGNPMFKLVDTYEVHSEADIKKYHTKFLDEGFEGSIIRLDLGDYEVDTRSKQLLKYKDFIDEEFKIIGAVEGIGNRAGTIGKFIMDYSHGKGSKTFESNIKGDFKYLRQIWENVDEYIGLTATVKYFELTPLKEDGTGSVPRFPYVIKIDRESYE